MVNKSLLNFSAILSNDNGMTAYICRRFIPTTASKLRAGMANTFLFLKPHEVDSVLNNTSLVLLQILQILRFV